MGQSGLRDIFSLFESDHLHADAVIAGGAKDAVEQSGAGLDRQGGLVTAGEVRLTDVGNSAAVVVSYATTLASDATMTLAIQMQDSPDDSVWTDRGTAFSDVITDPTVGATYTGTMAFRFDDLHLRDRYIRAQCTVTMSAAVVDTMDYGVALIVGNIAQI